MLTSVGIYQPNQPKLRRYSKQKDLLLVNPWKTLLHRLLLRPSSFVRQTICASFDLWTLNLLLLRTSPTTEKEERMQRKDFSLVSLVQLTEQPFSLVCFFLGCSLGLCAVVAKVIVRRRRSRRMMMVPAWSQKWGAASNLRRQCTSHTTERSCCLCSMKRRTRDE